VGVVVGGGEWARRRRWAGRSVHWEKGVSGEFKEEEGVDWIVGRG